MKTVKIALTAGIAAVLLTASASAAGDIKIYEGIL